ncbi:Hpt domain-containing protein [Janthinobacterium sp.]|uniref:Hpt domain-containing protein n=1 Tax=Janthinobacterium sp. TaxID=1871054 RepID=UPI0026348A72|nr:Hpt domain-containing protein [Janthinobacterium sp.]
MQPYRSIDPATLFHATGDDRDIFRTLSQIYLDTAPAMYAKVELAVRAGSPPAIVHSCHTLRGTVALLGARTLASRLAELEVLARHHGTVPPDWLDGTASELALIEAEVRRSMIEYPDAQP